MGVEAYGMVGLFAAFEAMSMLVDMTLSTTGTREIAARIHSEEGASSRDFLVILERAYIVFGLSLGTTLFFAAPFLAEGIKTSSLSSESIAGAARLLALVAVLRAPISLYRAVIQATQRQGLSSSLMAASAALRFGGAIALVSFYSTDIRAFAAWQCVCLAAEAAVTRLLAWRILPARRAGAGEGFRAFRAAAPYMGKMLLLAVTSLVLTQSDRLILAARGSLADIGHYNVAKTLSMGLLMAVSPMFTALFPRFTALHANGSWESIRVEYESSSTAAAGAAGAIAAALIFFSKDILGNFGYTPAGGHGAILSWLVFAATLNAVGGIPYALQLAIGRNDLPARVNLMGVPIFVVLAWWGGGRYGAVGVAGAFAGFNLGAFLAGAVMTHRAVPALGPASRWIGALVVPAAAVGALLLFATSSILTGAAWPARIAGAGAACLLTAGWLWRNLGPTREAA
jgi:O-antigen/teichoic acid export membrane protein